MTVQVRLKRARTPRSRERQGRPDYAAGRASAAEARGTAAGLEAPKAAPRRRHGGPSQDRALYSCQCGFVFDALVSTSVGCPHCGDTQAW